MSEYLPDDYVNYRMQKAFDTLNEVNVLIENQLWNTAVNRMYYACFYAVGALLVKGAIETSSHAGTRQKFGQLFVKTEKIEKSLGKHYSILFDKRHRGDYADFFESDEETVIQLLPDTKKLVEQIHQLLISENRL